MLVVYLGPVTIRVPQAFVQHAQHLVHLAAAVVLHGQDDGVTLLEHSTLLRQPFVIQLGQLRGAECRREGRAVFILAHDDVAADHKRDLVRMHGRHFLRRGFRQDHTILMVEPMERHIGDTQVAPHSQFPVLAEPAPTQGLPCLNAFSGLHRDVVVEEGLGRQGEVVLIVDSVHLPPGILDVDVLVVDLLDGTVHGRCRQCPAPQGVHGAFVL